MSWDTRGAMQLGPNERGLAELRRLSELKPGPVETVTRSTLTPDELREATRMVHEALGLPHPEGSCAECDEAFARHQTRVGP